jgi:hypothetical protein
LIYSSSIGKLEHSSDIFDPIVQIVEFPLQIGVNYFLVLQYKVDAMGDFSKKRRGKQIERTSPIIGKSDSDTNDNRM